jgi:hypothetical protein
MLQKTNAINPDAKHFEKKNTHRQRFYSVRQEYAYSRAKLIQAADRFMDSPKDGKT